MASKQAEAIKAAQIEYRKEQDAAGEQTLEQMRANSSRFGDQTAEPAGVTWEPVDAGGVPAIWVIPATAQLHGGNDRVLQYLHGGGYVLGSAETHRRLTGHLATAIGCRVLNVDYRLAPEQPHPGPVEDSVKAYRWLLDQGLRPEHLAIAGDSAGGGLTLATVLKLRADGLPQPAAAVPISPWTDMEATGESIQSVANRDVVLHADRLKVLTDLFLAGGNPRDPLAAPVYGDYTGICPLYIQVGGDEILLDDARRVEARARADGVDVQLHVFPEMQHVFQMHAGNMPEADDAIARIGAYLRPRLELA
jgi:acetyl esterase/lipase